MNVNYDQYTQSTDMLVHYLANSEKLVDPEKQVLYPDIGNVTTATHSIAHYQDEIKLDDDADNYIETKRSEIDKHTVSFHASERNNNDNSKEESDDDDDESKWTKEELHMKKLDMLGKLAELCQNYKISLSTNYSMESSYRQMKNEYDYHSNLIAKRNAVSWMSNMLIGVVQGIELMNDSFNPFDMKFNRAWSGDVSANINQYYEVLGELYEKYTTPGEKWSPELRLFLLLTGSAVSIQGHKLISNYVSENMGNFMGGMDKDQKIIDELRHRAVNKDKAEEFFNKEHEEINKKLQKMRVIEESAKDYSRVQKMAQSSAINSLRRDLVLSDAMSQSQQSQMFRPPSSLPSEIHKDLELQNQKLSEIKDMLGKIKTIGVSETSSSHTSSKNKSVSKTKIKTEETESQSKVSEKSNVSKISVNPRLDEILSNHTGVSSNGISRTTISFCKSDKSRRGRKPISMNFHKR